MGNIVFATPLEVAALTAGDEADEMPAAELLTMQPTDKWRAALANAFVVVDLGSATVVRLVALLATNATAAATWRIRAATSEANLTAAPGYDSTAIAFPIAGTLDAALIAARRVHGVKWLGAAGQNFRWWRVDLIDAGNPDGYLEAGRLYLAAGFQPATNYQFGAGLEPVDNTEHRETMGGNTVPGGGSEPKRVLRLPLVFAALADYRALMDLARLRGHRRDVLVVLDPDAPAFEGVLYCLARAWGPVPNTHHRWWQAAPEFVELI